LLDASEITSGRILVAAGAMVVLLLLGLALGIGGTMLVQ